MLVINLFKPDRENITRRSTLGFFPEYESQSFVNNNLDFNNYILFKSYEFEDRYIQVFFDELPLAKPIKHEDKYVLPFRDKILQLGDIIYFHAVTSTQDITKNYLLTQEGLVEVF